MVTFEVNIFRLNKSEVLVMCLPTVLSGVLQALISAKGYLGSF